MGNQISRTDLCINSVAGHRSRSHDSALLVERLDGVRAHVQAGSLSLFFPLQAWLAWLAGLAKGQCRCPPPPFPHQARVSWPGRLERGIVLGDGSKACRATVRKEEETESERKIK